MDITAEYRKDWEIGSYTALHRGVEFSSTTKCQTLEFVQNASLVPSTAFGEGALLDEHAVHAWLTKDLNFTEGAARKGTFNHSRGCRLLVATCDWETEKGNIQLSMTKATFDLVEDELGLPEQFLDLITSSNTRGFEYSIPRKDGQVTSNGFLFKVPFYRRNSFQLSLHHSPTSKITTAFLVIRLRSEVLDLLRTSINSHLTLCTNPLLLPVLLAKPCIDLSRDRLADSHEKLNKLEECMGQHEYIGRPTGNPLELDFLSTTRNLNWVANKIAVDIIRMKGMLCVLERMGLWAAKLNSGMEKGEGEEVIGDKMAFLMDNCRILLEEAEYEDKRAKCLIQVVYQFMAQKDAKVNIALAESSAAIAKAGKEDSAVMRTIAIESKKDSSAMKTIAVLGMFFLPGTFVAAIFAMPVFDWDGNTLIVKPGFKYYWAVTAPLTLFVLFSWSLAMLLPWKSWLSTIKGGGRL